MYRAVGIVIVVVILAAYWLWKRGKRTLVRASDGNVYDVMRGPDQAEAAEILARVNADIIRFLRWLKNTAGRLPRSHQKIIVAILRGYNFETVRETDPRNLSGDTSYTVRKGAALYLCLRRRDRPSEFVPYNVLMYVVLHEISHIGHYDGWGHIDEFWEVFLLILTLAVEFGIYRPTNYAAAPVVYCGLTVNYCPLFDSAARLPPAE